MRPWFNSWVRKIPWRRDRLPTPLFFSFPGGSAGKESTWNAGDLGSIPDLGRSPGEGNSYPLQYSALENFMDCIVRGVTKSRTRLNNFHFQEAQEVTEVQSQWKVRGSCHSSWNAWFLVDRRLCSMTCMYISDPSILMRCIMRQQQWAQASQFLVRQITYQTVLRYLRCLVFFFILFYQTAWT